MCYEKKKNIYMRIKDAMLKENEPKNIEKERKQWVLRHPPVRIKIAHTLKDFKKREV
jgi:hypothetical protein